jgi:effector-binding domain-containing protein
LDPLVQIFFVALVAPNIFEKSTISISRGELMTSDTIEFVLNHLEEILIASIRAPIQKRVDLKERFERLKEICGDAICGPALTVFHYDKPVKGFDAEACYPINHEIESEEIKCRLLEPISAFTYKHHGPYETLRNSASKVFQYLNSRGLPVWLKQREVYIKGPFLENPEDQITEIQAALHDWEQRFNDAVEDVIGLERKRYVFDGIEEVTPNSPAEKRGTWISGVIGNLESIADEEEISEVICRCAHIRPEADIETYRKAWDKNHDIDDVIKAYDEAQDWVEPPRRNGNVVYVSKIPRDKETWEKAKTLEDKIRAFCFCPIVYEMLDKTPRSFCYCGGGWARQIFERILNKPVKVELIKTVTKGDNVCAWNLYLPEGVAKN